ncbi:MAG: YbcC family protein [Flammeovirgaceae bacterium]
MNTEQVHNKIEKACNRIAPAWPLENSVAVNPYLGFSDMSFDKAAKIFHERGDIQLYMPIAFYLKRIESNEIRTEDIEKALAKKQLNVSVAEFIDQLKNLDEERDNSGKLPTLLGISAQHLGTDFLEMMIDHTSSWLSAYFNKNNGNQGSSEHLFDQWKKDAEVDRLPELMGVKNFRKIIKDLPEDSEAVILAGLQQLNVPEQLVEAYLHALLLQLVGWSSYCAGLDWQNNLYGGDGKYIKVALAILISWENALIVAFNQLGVEWQKSLAQSEHTLNDRNEVIAIKAILQDAFDFAYQHRLINKFDARTSTPTSTTDQRPLAQMVFCIDVRSEVYRRNLEAVNHQIETLGFAGFFGFPVNYKPINHTHGKNQCPVLIPSGPEVFETTAKTKDLAKVVKSRQRSGKLKAAWSKFKSGSVSSYSFVSPLGVFYLPKLISDSFGWTRPINDPKKKEFGSILSGHGKLDISSIPFNDRVNMAKSALSAMGILSDFAPFILITGHGATSVNNPHASGLDCGACGGNSGEINAITAQLILNDQEVREALKEVNIEIPEDTCFIACLHNTTTDEITIIDKSVIPPSQLEKFKEVSASLSLASQNARKYRSSRFGIDKKLANSSILSRANDWSQVRPEWGLAGCSSFIIAPRSRTKGIDLEGKAFLHSYEWESDKDFKVLETIITAPMIVTSWINLQYYASTVDNKRLGAGNKTLHNVTAGLGVLEGAKGDLRIGLPFQSIHDGKNYQHLPLRLNVVIEAPITAINEILAKHANVKDLCDHEWINLMIMDDNGKVSHRYTGNYNWEPYEKMEIATSNSSKRLVEVN